MTTRTSQESSVNPDRQEKYVFGDDSAFTLKHHASRTAAEQAAFFLPYLQPGMKLLDCGSGSGSITLGLAQLIAPGKVTAVDISEVEVTRSRSRAATEGVTNVRFEVGNIYNLDFPDESFDAIFSNNVLEHISEPVKVLEEMRRVLKPRGVIGIRDHDLGGSMFAPPGAVEPFALLHRAVWERVGGHPDAGRGLRGLLHEAGFVDVVTSASYEVYANPERLQLISDLIVSRCEEPDFVKHVVEYGLGSQEKLEEIKASARGLLEHPAAFVALAHAEVVGRKE